MVEKFINFFRGEDDNDPSFVRLVRNVLIMAIVVNVVALPILGGLFLDNKQSSNIFSLAVFSITLIVEVAAFFFLRKGNILLAKVIVPLLLIIGIAVVSANANGIRDTTFLAMPVVLVTSAILLGPRSIVLAAPLAVIASIIVAIIDVQTQRIAPPARETNIVIVAMLIGATGALAHFLVVRLNEHVARARRSEALEREENIELVALRATLEQRIQERTSALEEANRANERRAQQFSAIARVMNAVSSVQELDQLLPFVTEVISEEFDVYHVGIFLLDREQGLAVLRAANSEGGQRMLARKHSLAIGQTGIVGYVTATGRSRIASEVGTDIVYFDNPDLPDTRSEIALPLRYLDQVIGALDVQSVEANAFQTDDIATLTTLADQVAVAISNAVAIEEAKHSLAEAQSAIGGLAQEAWRTLRPAQLGLGYSYSESGVTPLQNPLDAKAEDENVLTIPIRLRGNVVGAMRLKSRQGAEALTQDDAEIAEAVAERLSLAIETTTLLQSTQRRADIERLTADIVGKISASTRFENILQTAAQELSRALGGSDVLVQIEPTALNMDLQ
ncbi:MAG: GAF domain-containing protein [Anaerolineales bacterium]|nr:GAF domain-containing protein [Anaerolineales bacterium]